MMREAEGWLRERGVAKLNLMVLDDNADALGFYQRLGYDVLKSWFSPGGFTRPGTAQ